MGEAYLQLPSGKGKIGCLRSLKAQGEKMMKGFRLESRRSK